MCLSSISSTLSPYSQLHFKDPRWDPRIVWSYYDGTKSQHKLRPWWTSPSPYLCPVRCQGVLFPWHEPHNRTYYFRVNWDKTHRFGRTCSIHDRLPTLPYCYMLMYVNILWYIMLWFTGGIILQVHLETWWQIDAWNVARCASRWNNTYRCRVWDGFLFQRLGTGSHQPVITSQHFSWNCAMLQSWIILGLSFQRKLWDLGFAWDPRSCWATRSASQGLIFSPGRVPGVLKQRMLHRCHNLSNLSTPTSIENRP